MSSTFAKLFRHSNFVRLGDFKNQIVLGKVVHRNEDDLYIDIGLKFNAVCRAPLNSKRVYGIGSDVRLLLQDPEISHRFLGSKFDLTLLEADATIVESRMN